MNNLRKASSFVAERLSTLSGSTLTSEPPVPSRFHSDTDLFDYVTGRIIYQAGVDCESKPMLVFCACNFPSPQEVDYDKVLNGAKYRPGWTWLFKAYRSLSRNAYGYDECRHKPLLSLPCPPLKKVGKQCDPNCTLEWHRCPVLYNLSWVDKLSDLAQQVPLDQIAVPPEVEAYNDTLEPRTVVETALQTNRHGGISGIEFPQLSPSGRGRGMFGVPLVELTGPDCEQGLPRVVQDCLDYIREHGLETEGIFRRSPSSVQLKQAKAAYNRSEVVNMNELGVHVAAVLLKMYFHELPTTILPVALYTTLPSMAECSSDAECAAFIRDTVLPQLPTPNRYVLAHIFYLLHNVSLQSEINKMNSHNLAIVWTPNLVKSDNLAMDMKMYDPNGAGTVGQLVRVAIDYYTVIFATDTASD
ncbi:hypothetical protein IWQ62_000059 [Dispira parvispora]|uniref:Rho-GAP domain-containing protein n=1 Tax=Dispira parvispora TaxID=1520584 RepID=A0A9W8B1G2_9FUNG|nr:hypothetical protein IWQ62_000059 [Dispira parvispora]